MERRLLAALAVRRPAAVSVDLLGEALWPDEPPASMRKTIQNNVLRLRARLGRSSIETVEHGYRLGRRSIWTSTGSRRPYTGRSGPRRPGWRAGTRRWPGAARLRSTS